MKLQIKKIKNPKLLHDEINIVLESSTNTAILEELKNYILEFEKNQNIIFGNIDNDYVPIDKNEIIIFYSDKKYNYCRTSTQSYKIKSKLYEIEKMDKNYIRLSKSCVANFKHIECFDLNTTGTIIVKFDDGTTEVVSRRRAKEVLDYLSERRI